MDITRWSHQNQIDYILYSQRWRSSIQSAKTRPGADCSSDHELLIAKFRLKLKKVGKTTTWKWTSLVAQTVKHLPTMRETHIQSLGGENPLEKEMAPHSSTLAWRIPRMEEPGRLQSVGSKKARHNWATSLSWKTTRPFRNDLNQIPYDYTVQVINRFIYLIDKLI